MVYSGYECESRYVIFKNDAQAKYLGNSGILFVNVTFYEVSQPFIQLIIIYAKYIGACYPLAFILMKSKSLDGY